MRYGLIYGTLLLAASTTSHANPIYSFSSTDFAPELAAIGGGVKINGGEVTAVDTTYNSSTEDFTWNYTVKDPGSAEHNGFWLVVSDGPDPKYNKNEYAILYGDLDAGKLSAFLYNGQNKANSFTNPAELLAVFENSISKTSTATTGEYQVTVEFNASAINAYNPNNTLQNDWDGVGFSSNVGIWFHPTANTSFEYDANNKLTAFDFHSSNVGYYDTNGQRGFSTVPEPASLALLFIGSAGFVVTRRRKKK